MDEHQYKDRLRKADWVVQPISISTARWLVEKYHYAKSATNTRVYTHGLFRKDEAFFDNHCLGVAWWLPPTKVAAIATFPEGEWQQVLSLTRLVLVPDLPKNACSFLLSQSIKLIDKTKWKCLVTYADTWKGHTGTIYKATNWEYIGLTAGSPVWVNEAGAMMGRKRGQRTMSRSEMSDLGFMDQGSYQKHKFRMILRVDNP